LGRRVKKAVYAYGSDGWELEKEILFVYDGWNLIQEIEVSAAGDPLFDKFYVWGPDLFQSIQGAGGIGGLVCRVSGGEVRHYFYDANGNVGQMVNPADGAVTARYEYDPFGNAVFVDGADAAGNAVRFSTKFNEEEVVNLFYYGYRYYVPELGRWLSRDSLEEIGHNLIRKKSEYEHAALNPVIFILNNPIDQIDPLGLAEYVVIWEMWSITIGAPGYARLSGKVISTEPDSKICLYPAIEFIGNFVGVSFPAPVSYTWNNVSIFEDRWTKLDIYNIAGKSEILTGISAEPGGGSFPEIGIFKFGGLRMKLSGEIHAFDISAGSHWKGGIHTVGEKFHIDRRFFRELTRQFDQ
jgi:RHS repeat-associated protein